MSLLAEAPPQLGLLVPVFFVILWCCIIASLSLTGGWHSLAKRFPAEPTLFRLTESDDGKRFRFASMAMGSKFYPVSYGSCLTIEVNSNGIYIKIMPFFRILHPPFLIPWSAIDDCITKKYFLIFSRTAVYLKNRQDPLYFIGSVAKEILRRRSDLAMSDSNRDYSQAEHANR